MGPLPSPDGSRDRHQPNRTPRQLFAINGTYHGLGLLIVAVIVSAWQ
jgi:hypothetical protein